jgi:transcriptional regulator with XRE-family HTH domain
MEKLEFNKAFGLFIKKKRTLKGWSQTDLASLLGNNSQNISRIERGELTPTIFWFQKLANAFDYSASEFLKDFEDSVKKNLSTPSN